MALRNGLLLVWDNSRPNFLISTQHVINPVTNQGHHLISIPCDVWHELVFLPSTKVYILVEMFYTDKNFSRFYEIYLRTLDGQLKHIEVPVYSLQLNYNLRWKSNNVVSINEVLYWNYGDRGSCIVSFNVFAKKFGIIHCPIDIFCNTKKFCSIKLAKIGGSLSLVEFMPDYDGDSPVINIWKLNEFSANGWEILYSLTGKQVSSRSQETYYPSDIIGSVNNESHEDRRFSVLSIGTHL
ncbi:hypothetical protein FRX31_004785 [Thalictrum thalictroides]|uniref:F-box associated domain-containing protein n=1 Tax=Thalictrum thalictroides TaxID=46969 RepID=A0A7J6X9N4_THATH|nr:hypothetical protein FRX31_004785 [Thalictrum thalictroides]